MRAASPTAGRRAAAVLGGFLVSVGSLVLAGWALDLPALVRILPILPAMQVDAALAFVASGVAVVGFSTSRRYLEVAGAAVATFLGLAVLGRVYLGLPDIASFRALFGTTDGGAVPGSAMAPGTAFAFVLFGISRLVPAREWRGDAPALVHQLAGAALILLGGVDATLLIFERFGAAGPLGSQMALHTAVGFLALGMSILAAGEEEAPPGPAQSSRSGATVVGVAGLATVLALVQLLRFDQQQEVRDVAGSEAKLVRQEIRFALDGRIGALEMMALTASLGAGPEVLLGLTREVMSGHPALRWMGLIDADGAVLWALPDVRPYGAVVLEREAEGPGARMRPIGLPGGEWFPRVGAPPSRRESRRPHGGSRGRARVCLRGGLESERGLRCGGAHARR